MAISKVILDGDTLMDVTDSTSEPSTMLNGTVGYKADGVRAVGTVTIPTKTSDLVNDGSDGTDTYVESGDLATVATSGAYSDLSGKPTIPTKTSDLTNDSNFVADASYVHTDNNYTATEKSKLSGIASGAEVNVQADWNVTTTTSDAYIKNKPTIPSKTSDLTNDSNFVVDANYVHTDSNYTSAEKTKLSGIAAGAEVNQNAFSTVMAGNVSLSSTSKTGTLEVIAGNNITFATSTASTNPQLTIKATNTTYSDATQSTHGLMSTTDKTKLDGIASGAEVNVQANWTETSSTSDAYIQNKPTIPTKTSDLTNDSNFVTDASYVHTDNNYTSTEKSKLEGIAAGAEVNQSAFSYVRVGTTTLTADDKTDTLTVTAGSNITLTPNTTTDTFTIAATDTTYSDATTTTSGLMSATDKTKLNGIATGAEVNVQANWTEADSASDAYIQNKPNLATVATSGSYADLSNKPTIPTATSQLTNDSGFIAEDTNGDVAITGNLSIGNVEVRTNIDLENNPSEQIWTPIVGWRDVDNTNWPAYLQPSQYANGMQSLSIGVRTSNNSTIQTHAINLNVAKDGTRSVGLDQTAWLNALGLTTTNWVYMKGSSSSNDQYARWRVKAGIVFVEWYFTTGSGHSGSSVTLGTISSGYRPSKHISGACYGTGNNVLWWEITTAGNLTFGSKGSSSSPAVYGTASYPL